MISVTSFRWFSKNHNIYMKHKAKYQQLEIKSEMRMSMCSIFNFSANFKKTQMKNPHHLYSVNAILEKNLMEELLGHGGCISLCKIWTNCSPIGGTTVFTNICDVLFLKNRLWGHEAKMMKRQNVTSGLAAASLFVLLAPHFAVLEYLKKNQHIYGLS